MRGPCALGARRAAVLVYVHNGSISTQAEERLCLRQLGSVSEANDTRKASCEHCRYLIHYIKDCFPDRCAKMIDNIFTCMLALLARLPCCLCLFVHTDVFLILSSVCVVSVFFFVFSVFVFSFLVRSACIFLTHDVFVSTCVCTYVCVCVFSLVSLLLRYAQSSSSYACGRETKSAPQPLLSPLPRMSGSGRFLAVAFLDGCCECLSRRIFLSAVPSASATPSALAASSPETLLAGCYVHMCEPGMVYKPSARQV